ncbi:GTPase, G3E family [Lachnospiraceae bacterium]|nr:GTPase, G3E family [Lachnospiraceae bacterium]
MDILIVSGFLGAGKTTFIKELIRRTGTNPVILENEYGDNSIDAEELRSQAPSEKKLEILEFMEGCVCCTMKDSFVNSVFTVYSGLSPKYLIIEPTGVGKLSNIINNLKPLLHGDINLLKPIVVTAPRSYSQNMAEWKELYSDQIKNAGTVVFSKCENNDPESLEMTRTAIKSINPDADIISCHYSAQSDDWWNSLMEIPASKSAENVVSSDEETEFSQLTLDRTGLKNPGQLIMLLEDCLRGSLGHIVRAKGTVPVGEETLRFDLADGMYSISDSPLDADQCVFIGSSINKSAICRRMGSTKLFTALF